MTTMETKNKEQDEQALRRLLEIMADLRAEHGCPWDKEQDHKSLRKYVLEEAYEVVDAINQEDDSLIVEELGDLILQIVFHAQIAKEEGRFTFADIANGISEKMIRRHPHVFGAEHCDTPSEVMVTWAQVKAKEKAGSQERRMDVPLAFPALYRSEKLQKKAAEVGFDWEQSEAVRQKILEELGEVDEDVYKRQGGMRMEETKIILRNIGRINPNSIEDYVRAGGYSGLRKALTMKGEEIISLLKDSNLRGRGGAGFLTGLKWSFVAKEPSDQKYVICNADEGEPATNKDRVLMSGDPHSVIEGMAIAGYAVGEMCIRDRF